nr:hypothetical protein Iba_chr14cCG8220 [Ipomoea batatas]
MVAENGETASLGVVARDRSGYLPTSQSCVSVAGTPVQVADEIVKPKHVVAALVCGRRLARSPVRFVEVWDGCCLERFVVEKRDGKEALKYLARCRLRLQARLRSQPWALGAERRGLEAGLRYSGSSAEFGFGASRLAFGTRGRDR